MSGVKGFFSDNEVMVGRAQGAALALEFSIVTTFWSDFSVRFFWSDSDTDKVMELVVPPPPLDGASVASPTPLDGTSVALGEELGEFSFVADALGISAVAVAMTLLLGRLHSEKIMKNNN